MERSCYRYISLHTMNLGLTGRISLFLVTIIAFAIIVTWLDAPLYDILFKPPLTAYLDIILLSFIIESSLFLWIVYDLLIKAMQLCRAT